MNDWVIYIIKGVGVTLKYTLISLALGGLLSMVLAAARLSSRKPLRFLARGYVSVFRGTPLLAQLMLVHYGIPSLTGHSHSVFASGIVTFSLNSAAYMSEVIRAGLESIPKGQYEACLVLGIRPWNRFFDILLPQALKAILPALINEMVDLTKESSLISTIGGADLLFRSKTVAAQKYTYFAPLLVAAGCYYVLVLVLTAVAHWVKARLSSAPARAV